MIAISNQKQPTSQVLIFVMRQLVYNVRRSCTMSGIYDLHLNVSDLSLTRLWCTELQLQSFLHVWVNDDRIVNMLTKQVQLQTNSRQYSTALPVCTKDTNSWINIQHKFYRCSVNNKNEHSTNTWTHGNFSCQSSNPSKQSTYMWNFNCYLHRKGTIYTAH